VRRRPATVTPMDDLAQLAGNDDTGEDAAELISTDAAISLIASLPRDQAEAVLLRVVMGLDAKTAAKVLGKSAGAVRTAAYRGLHRLAQYLNEPGELSELISADCRGPSPPAELASGVWAVQPSRPSRLASIANGPRPVAPW
jgi:Sigma-70, region 4